MPYIVFMPNRGVDCPGIGIYSPISFKLDPNYEKEQLESKVRATWELLWTTAICLFDIIITRHPPPLSWSMSLKIPPTPEKQNPPLLFIVNISPFCHPNDLSPCQMLYAHISSSIFYRRRNRRSFVLIIFWFWTGKHLLVNASSRSPHNVQMGIWDARNSNSQPPTCQMIYKTWFELRVVW